MESDGPLQYFQEHVIGTYTKVDERSLFHNFLFFNIILTDLLFSGFLIWL